MFKLNRADTSQHICKEDGKYPPTHLFKQFLWKTNEATRSTGDLLQIP